MTKLNLTRLMALMAAAVIGTAVLTTLKDDAYAVPTLSDDGMITSKTRPPHGNAASSTVSCDQAGIQKLVDDVSAKNIEANLRELVQEDSMSRPNELVSRHISSPGNKLKTAWARQKYASYGLQDASQEFTTNGFGVANVVGRIAGSDPDKIYAASGHIDTMSPQFSTLAPGAEDDGSGVAAAMEAGRVLKHFQPCMKASVDLIGFNDEEENMLGSDTYARSMHGKDFKGMYNMDMVGYAPHGECTYNFYNDAGRDKPLADKMTSVNTKYGIGLDMTSHPYDENDVDAATFWDAGLPASYQRACISDENYPGYHQITDNVKNVDFQQVAKMSKAIVASLAELSSQ